MSLSPAFIALMAAVSPLLAKGGIIDQIARNHRRRATDGMSGLYFILGLNSYAWMTAYGFDGGGRSLIWGQGPGVLLSLVVVAQVIWYRRGERP